MKTIGLTGGIGMGKSAAADLLRQSGAAVIDTDVLARLLVEPGQPALEEVVREFGAGVLAPDGTLSREKLAARVFAEPQARQTLESILHPRIRSAWLSQAEQWRNQRKQFCVVVIPLLFETNAQQELDATVCVACSARLQQQRLNVRGWTTEEIAKRMAAQWTIDQKIAHSDYVIWNEAGLDVLSAQLDRVVHLALTGVR